MTAAPHHPIVLHGFDKSGHAHRALLMLRLLGLPCQIHQVDLAGGEQKTEQFRTLNPFATVPVIEDHGVVIADSCAILVYLATQYDAERKWLPRDAQTAAEVQRWLSVAQGPLFLGPCRARLVTVFGAPHDLAQAQQIAQNLFVTLDAWLAERHFLVGDGPTIADVALYSYTAHAPEGGVDLAPFPHIGAWLKRIEALPGFEAMPATRAGLLAA